MKSFLLPDEQPSIQSTAFIAGGSVVIGGVSVGAYASIWFGCVLRGDINHIRIGDCSNIQDGTIIHVSDVFPTIVGDRVSVGHRAIIHACEIGDETLVGMGSIVMDGAVIGRRCVIGAGSLVTKGMQVPDGSLVMGSPAKIIRGLTSEEQQMNVALAEKYVEVARRFRALPEGTMQI